MPYERYAPPVPDPRPPAWRQRLPLYWQLIRGDRPVGTLLLLFWFTRSMLLPVKAVLTNLLSIGAALGAVVWVFQQGHLASWLGTEGLDATHLSVPVLVGAIAFGLSVDYEVFLLSRIRERWLAGTSNDEAVAQGAVNRAVPHAELEKVALEWGALINSKSPTAMRMLKYGFNLPDEGLVGQQLFAGEATRLAYGTEEAQEGRDAFVEKRPRDFSKFPWHY